MTPVRDELSRRSLLIGISVCGALLSVAAGVAIFFAVHHESLPLSQAAAVAEIQKVRERFAGQKPPSPAKAHR